MIGFTSRSTTGVPARVDALAAAVELAEDRLDEERVAFGRHVVDKAAARLRHGTTHTLVALLGATGSGKSSVANAVVGDDIATTGVRRPTTSSTLACYWLGADDDVEEPHTLLDWLEVTNRHRVSGGPEGLDRIVLLDVPDHDSVADAHREEMERIAEHADMLLWVTDPEKYADKAMHDYLGALRGHGAVMALLLNKIDQLTEADTERCVTDLRRLVEEAGLGEMPVIALSAVADRDGPAQPDGGAVSGLDELLRLLVATGEAQRAMVDRLGADVTLAADDLLAELGPDRRNDTNGIGAKVGERLATELVDASGLAVVSDAVAAGHRRDAARSTGWPFTRWVRRLRPHPLNRLHLGQGTGGRASLPTPAGVQVARTENAIRQTAASVAADLPPPWPSILSAAATPDGDELADRLDSAIAGSARSLTARTPLWWRVVNGLQLLLAAAVVVGAVWLGLLAAAAYLRIPEPPTPEIGDTSIPWPTALLLGGIALGLVVAFVSARFASVGASRRARTVRTRATGQVRSVAEELIIEPMQVELDRRNELRQLLTTARGDR